MTLPIELDGPRLAPRRGGPAGALVVFLHGLGADGRDLLGLGELLAEVLPEAAFVAPDAPFPCDMAPMGWQWFSLQVRAAEPIYMGAEGARGILDRFLDRELERYGLAEDRLALVGFSQGTMVALHTALRRPRAVAGVIGYSGLLVAPERLSAEIRSRPPVLLLHGEEDQVLPADYLPVAERALRANGVPVEAELRPGLGHGIDQAGIARGAAFLRQVLGRVAVAGAAAASDGSLAGR